MTNNRTNIIPFGKYKGRDILEVLETDPSYLQWLTGQDWFRDRHVYLHQTIINRGSEPEDTPDHNALQVLFLDHAFCLKFCRALDDKFDAKVKDRLESARGEHGHCTSQCTVMDQPIAGIEFKFHPEFEDHGIDVRLRVEATSINHRDQLAVDYHHAEMVFSPYRDPSWCIEIKPTVGDDYPAVLRQMKRLGATVLFLRDYTGQGASREQFLQTFTISKFRVVFLDQCA